MGQITIDMEAKVEPVIEGPPGIDSATYAQMATNPALSQPSIPSQHIWPVNPQVPCMFKLATFDFVLITSLFNFSRNAAN